MRYDGIDYFWFTLVHELAHVSLYLEDDGKAAFFGDLDLKESSWMEIDDPDLKESSRKEKEADDLTEDALIPPELWESSAAKMIPTHMAVYELSQRAEVHMAVAAGRARYEHNTVGCWRSLWGEGRLGVYLRGCVLRWGGREAKPGE